MSGQWWVVTDLDGTLMDHSYSWAAAEAAIAALQKPKHSTLDTLSNSWQC